MIKLNRKVRFSHPDITYSVTNYTEYLFGSVGLKVNADVRVDVSWSSQDINMKFTAADQSVERLDPGLSDFLLDQFRAGDTISFTGSASNNITTTITSISDDGRIMYVAAALTNETVVANVLGETPIIAMDFYPNCIANNSEFSLFNLVDRETQPHYYADTITTDSANPTVMLIGTNSKGWVTPSDRATIYRSSFTNHVQTFVISHTFSITPIALSGHLSNLQNIQETELFRDGGSLKYVFQVDGKFTAYDPTIVHTTDGNVQFPFGQVGWFNEFINGRSTIWTKESILYYDITKSIASGTIVPLTGIGYCTRTAVYATVNSQTVTPGTEATFKVQVMYLPQNEDEYVNTNTDYKTNFIYERAIVVPSGATVQGENTGDYHFLKNVTATALNTHEVLISFEIDFSSVVEDLLDAKDSNNLNYIVFITPQHTSNTFSILSIDQTAVIMDVNKYVCDKDDSTLFQIIDEVQFFPYPQCSGVGYSNFNVFPRDTVLVKAQFHIKQGTELDLVTLKNISAGIYAVKQNDVEEFTLELFNINTDGFLPNCDNIQEIFFAESRDFILPTGDCRNEIRLFRMPTLDIAGYSAYELIYPFKVRWEEWRTLSGANRCFPDPTQNWSVYGNQLGWSIKFSIKAQVSQQGTNHTTDFEHIVWGTIQDPCGLPYSAQFNTMDVTGVNDYEGVVAKDVDTFVEATITGDFSGLTVDQLYGILTLDAWGVGGVAYSQEIGTRIDVDSGGVWYGAGSGLVATLTKVSNSTVKLSAFINYLYLPTDTDQFIFSARIGEYVQSQSSSGADCLNEIEFIEFTCGELDIVEVVDTNTFIVSGIADTADQRDVVVENLILTFVTATTWSVSGGTINGAIVLSGTVGGNIIKAPTHPYTDANVGDTLQGDITGTLNTSLTQINGIGEMQIGCTFFVS